MILHTLNASPSSSAFTDCLKTIAEGDAVVLMGDGVYAAIEHTDASKVLEDTDARRGSSDKVEDPDGGTH